MSLMPARHYQRGSLPFRLSFQPKQSGLSSHEEASFTFCFACPPCPCPTVTTSQACKQVQPHTKVTRNCRGWEGRTGEEEEIHRERKKDRQARKRREVETYTATWGKGLILENART